MHKILYAACIAIALTSCTSAEFIQHTPTMANTGQHTDKNQLHGKVLYSTGNSTANAIANSVGGSPYEKVNGVQAQGSYSVSSSLAAQGSFMHSSEEGGSIDNSVKTVVYKYNRNVSEFGLAYFDNINQQKTFFIEMAAGGGLGGFKTTEANSTIAPGGRFYDHHVTKFYLQPSVYFASKSFSMSMGGKISFINFTDIKTNYTSLERETRNITTDNKLSTTTLDLFSKADVYLSRLPWLGFNAQALFSTDLGKKFNYNQTDNNFGIGLSFRFGQMIVEKE